MKQTLIDIVKRAGALARESYYKTTSVQEKSPKDFTTETDLLIEKEMINELRALYPQASIYGEECGEFQGLDDRLFVIDPIDGTANFIFGVPHFAVSLAEIVGGEVITAIVYNPMSEDLFYADTESKALLNGKPISVSDRKDLCDAYVIMGFSAHSTNIARYEKEWPQLFSDSKKALGLLSPSLNLCAVAMGKSDAFVDFGCSFEGQVAGAFILQKAGGNCRNYGGEDYDFREVGIVASNGVVV